ncbi:MAG: recombinase family protein [Clostridia bacterium]
MIFAYARVSTSEQKNDRQIAAIQEYAKAKAIMIEKIFTEKITGSHFERPEYEKLNEVLRAGDTLIVKEIDRLGRNMNQIRVEWNKLITRDIDIIIIDTPMLNTAQKNDLEKTLISNIVFELLSYMAEKERTKILERQAEGISAAKQKGVYKGRKPSEIPNFQKVSNQWRNNQITATQAAELLKISRSTFYRRIKVEKK